MRAEQRARDQASVDRSPPSLADLQRQARENWLRIRQELAEKPIESSTSRGRDEDLGR
jgi:hypothetical protein